MGISKGTSRRYRSMSEWSSIVSRQSSSGLGVVEFCKSEGLSAVSFYAWRKRLGVESSGSGSVFSRIDIETPVSAPELSLRILLPGGVELLFGELPPPAWVIGLSQALEGHDRL
jgi:hypothetical protein